MNKPLIAAVLVFAIACGGDPAALLPRDPKGASWSDDILWAVLQARDQRNGHALLHYLHHERPEVRAQAAMAFASSPDPLSIQDLVRASNDNDPSVRKAVALAIGNASDSLAWRALLRASDAERDTSVLRIMIEQAFKAEVDLGAGADPAHLFDLLASGSRSIRTRAAQQLGRGKADAMVPLEQRMLQAAGSERDVDVRMFLVGALKHYRSDEAKKDLMRWAEGDSLVAIRVSALRALGTRKDAGLQGFFLDRINDGSQAVRLTAVEQLERVQAPLDADEIWKVAQMQGDPFTQIPLYGLVLRHGAGGTRLIARKLLEAQAALDNMAYAEAAILRAQANDSLPITWALLRDAMRPERSLVMRTTALELALALPGYAPKEGEAPGEAYVRTLIDALTSHDAGMMTAAADAIANAAWAQDIKDALLPALVVIEPELELPRDLECALAVRKAIAKCKGEPAPSATAPPFNHPIDRQRLVALNDPPQYRIKTTKGEIVIALEPATAPGSCVAFDSLATAGYYSGKSFHRVISNFVAQGGCPRGDGWGGMNWTLRTEVGYEGFTKGAVGLASAGRDTESCQFFIMTAAAPHLDGRYTRFAHVVEGQDVADALAVGDRILAVEKLR